MDRIELFKLAEIKDVECFETDILNATYYILADGTKVSFGYIDGYRTDDHRILFSLFDNIEYNDFKALLEKTGVLGYCPETKIAWCLKNQKLTEKQKQFLIDNNIELSRDEI